MLCAGLPRSGSTWAFNVAARLARHGAPGRQVAMIYSDGGSRADAALLRGDLCLIKSHAPSPLLIAAMAWSQAPVLITVRDPRDSLVSLMRSFDYGFLDAVRTLAHAADRLMELAQNATACLLRYEDDFAGGAHGVGAIADHLLLAIDPATREAIAEAMSRPRVRKLIESTQFKLFPGESQPLPADAPHTQWHPSHVGDGRVGKYAESLTSAETAICDYMTRDYMRRFGYAPHAAAAPLAPGAVVRFGGANDGAAYLADGFSVIEEWGVWTAAEFASLVLKLAGPASWLSIDFAYRLGPCLRTGARHAELLVNGTPRATLACAATDPDTARLIVWLHEACGDELHLAFEIAGARSPYDLSLSDDRRPIGVGLISLGIAYG